MFHSNFRRVLFNTLLVGSVSNCSWAFVTEFDISLTYDNALENPQTSATAVAAGSIYISEWNDGRGSTRDNPSLSSTDQISDFITDVLSGPSASASVATRSATGGSLRTGHFGSVPTYSALPKSITASASVSGNQVNLSGGSFLTFEQRLRIDGPPENNDGSEFNTFVNGGAVASYTADVPNGTKLTGVSASFSGDYIFGQWDGSSQNFVDTFDILDPATTFSIDIHGTPISGGVVLNNAGDITVFGDVLYDQPTNTFTINTSAVPSNLAVGTQVDVELAIMSRLPGDFNNDRLVDAQDIDDIFAKINQSYAPTSIWDTYDLNLDGVVDHGTSGSTDTNFLIEVLLMTHFGDVNLDGAVDQSDLNIVQGNWGQTGLGWAGGDMNGNGMVEMGDMGYVLNNWGSTYGSFGSITAVPEPIAAASLLAALVLFRRNRVELT
ncbi:MAG: hypothetical protein AAGF84_08695 [Planctomycetota bacterium]